MPIGLQSAMLLRARFAEGEGLGWLRISGLSLPPFLAQAKCDKLPSPVKPLLWREARRNACGPPLSHTYHSSSCVGQPEESKLLIGPP